MDVSQTVSGYITKMVSVGDGQAGSNAAKMKILLLDSETVSRPIVLLVLYSHSLDQVSILSSATTQSSLLNHEVYLTEYEHLYKQQRPHADRDTVA